MKAICSVILLTLLGLSGRALAQPGALDPSFVPALSPDAQVYVIALQTNGQILIGGAFTATGGISAVNIARLNPDGSLDPTFNPGTAVDRGFVTALAVQPDGKIVVGGAHDSSFGIAQRNLTRLNPDGTVDVPFDQIIYVDAPVNAVVVQDDGKILLGGGFVNVNFNQRRSVARLNEDGTLDTGFDACIASTAGTGATGLSWQSNGAIFASGRFTFDVGVARDGIAKLRSCGDVDVNYDPQPGIPFGTTVFATALRENGTLLLGGDFQTFQFSVRGGVVQLTESGEVDGGFNPGSGINQDGTVYAITRQGDEKALIAGNFSVYDGQLKSSLARINSDGSLDGAFDAGLGPNDSVSSLVIQSDGRILVAGKFNSFNGVARNGLARIKGDPAPFHLDAPSLLGGGQWQMVLHGEAQAHYEIQTSSNLVHWSSLTNFTATSAATPFVDENAAMKRFYRAVLLP